MKVMVATFTFPDPGRVAEFWAALETTCTTYGATVTFADRTRDVATRFEVVDEHDGRPPLIRRISS